MHSGGHRRRCGFTLVEMLVTLAVFSLAMSSLVLGLRSGIRACQSVQAHQTREASVAHALDRIRTDFRRIAILSQEQPALQETREGNSLQELALTTLGSRMRQRAGLGSVWLRVVYMLEAEESRTSWRLVRTESPGVTDKPIEGADAREVLLEGLKGWRVQYSGSEGTTERWENSNELPRSVDVTLDFQNSRSVRVSTWVPAGAWGTPAS